MDINFKKIYEYRQMINELLKQKPELRPLQEKINATLAKAGSVNNRLTAIQNMMIDKVMELQEKLLELKSICTDALEQDEEYERAQKKDPIS